MLAGIIRIAPRTKWKILNEKGRGQTWLTRQVSKIAARQFGNYGEGTFPNDVTHMCEMPIHFPIFLMPKIEISGKHSPSFNQTVRQGSRSMHDNFRGLCKISEWPFGQHSQMLGCEMLREITEAELKKFKAEIDVNLKHVMTPNSCGNW